MQCPDEPNVWAPVPKPILKKMYEMFVAYDEDPRTRKRCSSRVFPPEPHIPSFEEFAKTYWYYVDSCGAMNAFYFDDAYFNFAVKHRLIPPGNRWCTPLAENGLWESLKKARALGYEWNEYTFVVAVATAVSVPNPHVNIDIMEWLRTNGCPWGVRVTNAAAAAGPLEHLIWLIDNGCPVASDIVEAAVLGGNLETLKYLIEELHCSADSLQECQFINDTEKHDSKLKKYSASRGLYE